MIVTIAIELSSWIVNASSPSRATLSSTTRASKLVQPSGPGGFTVIEAVVPKSLSVFYKGGRKEGGRRGRGRGMTFVYMYVTFYTWSTVVEVETQFPVRCQGQWWVSQVSYTFSLWGWFLFGRDGIGDRWSDGDSNIDTYFDTGTFVLGNYIPVIHKLWNWH